MRRCIVVGIQLDTVLSLRRGGEVGVLQCDDSFIEHLTLVSKAQATYGPSRKRDGRIEGLGRQGAWRDDALLKIEIDKRAGDGERCNDPPSHHQGRQG